MAKKMTVVEKYGNLIEKYADIFTDEEIAFLRERSEAHAKKNANRKPTKAQEENKALAEQIIEYLTSTKKKMQVKTMIKEIPCLAEMDYCPTQRVTAILAPYYDKGAGILQKEVEKGVTYYFVGD